MVVICLFIGGAFSRVQGQEAKAVMSLNLGVQTNLFSESSFDNAWFTLDTRFGIAVGQSFEISPEVMAMVDDSFNFDAVWLYPGVMLNFKLSSFFVGAGAILPIVFYDGESDSGRLRPKFNFGYRAGSLTLTAYIITLTEEYADFLEYNYIGATIGYIF